MEKPKGFIHIKKTDKFPDFGVLIIGRTAIPVYILVNAVWVLSALLLIPGTIVAVESEGTSWGLMALSLTPVGLLLTGLLLAGIYNGIAMWVRDIKKANRIERGLERY